MCGIVGVVTAEKSIDAFDRRKFIEQALIIDTLRGDDGAGIFVVKHKPVNSTEIGKAGFAKMTNTGYTLVNSEQWAALFNHNQVNDYKYMVGHNRSATRGGINIEATHPFQEGDITLVHNGTLDSTARLGMSQYASGATNDSHTICHNLAKFPAEEVLSKLDGAFALVWHDARDDSLNFIRNSLRPLHLAKTAKKDTIYFASEGEMLYWLDTRLNIGMQQIVSLEPMNWLKFLPNQMIPEVRKIEHVKSSVTFQPASTSYKGGAHSSGTNPTSYSGGAKGRGTHHTLGVGIVKDKYKIPKPMAEALYEETDILTEELKNFVPVKFVNTHWPNKQKTCVVWGYIREFSGQPGPSCMIHGVPTGTAELAFERIWTIRPIGFRWLEQDNPCVIGKLTSTASVSGVEKSMPNENKGPFPSTWRLNKQEGGPPPEASFSEEATAEFLEACGAGETFFIGPHNKILTRMEWLEATANGCIDCTGGVDIDTADRVLWVNGGADPLCVGCREKWSEEEAKV